jgi:predicted nucleic acid-binding protein
MAICLLDTSVIIDTINGKRNRGQLLESLVEQGHLLACCSINVTEFTLVSDPTKKPVLCSCSRACNTTP